MFRKEGFSENKLHYSKELPEYLTKGVVPPVGDIFTGRVFPTIDYITARNVPNILQRALSRPWKIFGA